MKQNIKYDTTKKLYTCVFLVFFLSVNAFASLNWKTTTITIEAKPQDIQSIGVFEFKNVGKSAVTITNTKSSCGCTVVKLEKKTYKPGESGKIEAYFKFGGVQGVSAKDIQVTTDSDDKTTVLNLITIIPKIIDINPRFVYWNVGDPPETKIVSLNLNIGEEAHITEVQEEPFKESPALDIELQEEPFKESPALDTKVKAEPGKILKTLLKKTGIKGQYLLEISPRRTDKELRTKMVIKTDYPKEAPKSFSLFVFIKKQ